MESHYSNRTGEYTTVSRYTTREASTVRELALDPVSSELRGTLQLINYVILCGCISLSGIGANIVNIIVFVKQGFKDSINISLLGLAIADLACLVTMLWTSICYSPLFEYLELPLKSLDVMYVSGGWLHVCFNRITSFITAFITLERCLCITLPLKVKSIITPFRTKVINVFMFAIIFAFFAPFYFVHKLEWSYNQLRNRTILSLAFTDDREIVEYVTFPIHSVALPFIFLVSVAICTIILVVKLNEKTKWRKKTVVQTDSKHELKSLKEKKVVKMVTFISSIFIICFVPPTANFFMMVYYPEFSVNGRLQNTFFVCWSVSFVLETLNSSVNIFVYVKMSTKFRTTLAETFCGFLNK